MLCSPRTMPPRCCGARLRPRVAWTARDSCAVPGSVQNLLVAPGSLQRCKGKRGLRGTLGQIADPGPRLLRPSVRGDPFPSGFFRRPQMALCSPHDEIRCLRQSQPLCSPCHNFYAADPERGFVEGSY